MSKKKEKDKKDAPIDYQLDKKNLQYTIVIKDTDIERLKEDIKDKMQYILSLEKDISTLRANEVNAFELENKLKKVLNRNEKLEKESQNFNNKLMETKNRYEEEKKRIENTYQSQINHLRVTMDAYIEKVKLTNQLLIDKEKLEKNLEEASNKNKEIIEKNKEALTTLKIKNEIKFTNLKNKMTENIIKTKNRVTDLNLQYMDVSSKLTLLQNHQLLIQIEYLTQQIDELKEKNKSLEKQIYDLSKEIEIHKEVELSLAEKNKTLSIKADKSNSKNLSITSYGNDWGWGEKTKNKKISKFNSKHNLNTTSNIKSNNIRILNEEDKYLDNNNKIYRKTISFNNIKNNKNVNVNQSTFNSVYFNNSNSLFNSNIFKSKNTGSNDNSKMLNLERKVINLEKKLSVMQKDYNYLLDKNDFFKNILQNYENKYSGLFNFLEDCLNNFYNDEELKNNKEIYVNIDSIKKGDFNLLSKEEKYSTLIILMKYLIPLMDRKGFNEKKYSIDNINVKYHEFHPHKKIISFTNRKNKKTKNYIMNTVNNFYNQNKKSNNIVNKSSKNEFDPLPSITKISLNGSPLIINKSVGRSKTNNNIK